MSVLYQDIFENKTRNEIDSKVIDFDNSIDSYLRLGDNLNESMFSDLQKLDTLKMEPIVKKYEVS